MKAFLPCLAPADATVDSTRHPAPAHRPTMAPEGAGGESDTVQLAELKNVLFHGDEKPKERRQALRDLKRLLAEPDRQQRSVAERNFFRAAVRATLAGTRGGYSGHITSIAGGDQDTIAGVPFSPSRRVALASWFAVQLQAQHSRTPQVSRQGLLSLTCDYLSYQAQRSHPVRQWQMIQRGPWAVLSSAEADLKQLARVLECISARQDRRLRGGAVFFERLAAESSQTASDRWQLRGEATHVAASLSSQRLAVCTAAGKVYILRENAGTQLSFLGLEAQLDVCAVSSTFDRDGGRLAAVCCHGNLSIFAAKPDWSCVLSTSLTSAELFAAAFCPAGNTIAVVGRVPKVHLLEVPSLAGPAAAVGPWFEPSAAQRQSLDGHSAPVVCVAFRGDGRRLASGSLDCTVRVWAPTVQGEYEQLKVLNVDVKAITGLAFSPDSRQLAAVSLTGVGKIYDSERLDLVDRFGDDGLWGGNGANGLAWSPGGDQLAVPRDDGHVAIWSSRSGRWQQTFAYAGHTIDSTSRGVWSASFSHDGQKVISVDRAAQLHLWEVT